MSFVLRKEGDTTNPTLATPYGLQITGGQLMYWRTDNGITKCIYILGEGEMDGMTKVYHHGQEIPEFINGSRVWKFHAGTITKQPVYKRSTVLDAGSNRLTFPAHGYSNSDVVVTVGTDFPSGISAQEYYVKVITGDIIELHTNNALNAIVDFGAYSGQVSLYKKGGTGFEDPLQGRPEFFPTLNYTFSGICYIEINMTAEMSAFADGGEPEGFKFMVRGKRVQNYTSTGLLADEFGVAYPDQNNLPSQTKFFSANNALIAVDIALNKMNMSKDRINWGSFVAFRERCKEVINWDSGSQVVTAYPVWIVNYNAVIAGAGELYKSGFVTGWGDSGATTQTTVSSGNFIIEGVHRSGIAAIGVANNVYVDAVQDLLYGIEAKDSGSLVIWAGGNINEVINYPYQNGNRYKVELLAQDTGVIVNFYANDTLLKSITDTGFSYSGGIRGAWAGHSPYSRFSELKIYPLSGSARNAERYNAHIVFPTETPAIVAFEQCFSRAPGCHWQDVNGKINFIVFPDYVTPESYEDGKRVKIGKLLYDPNLPHLKSNIVINTPSYYFKPTEEKINFTRIGYRNLDDEFYKQDYSFGDRPSARDEAEILNDSGIIPIGVATKSLADRIGETILRFGTDLDLFVQIKGMPNCYQFAKGDVIELAHDVPAWDVYNSKEFLIIEEIFEPTLESAGDKSFVLQIYRPDFYSDTAHGALPKIVDSSLFSVIPPTPLSISFLQDVEQNGADVTINLKGELGFDTTFNKKQKARIYYKHETGVEESLITLEQLNAGTETIDFSISNLLVGTYFFRIFSENSQGKLSDEPLLATFTVVDSLYPRKELLSYNSLAGFSNVDNRLTKTATNGWNNSIAYGSRQIGNTAIESTLEFTVDSLANSYIVGLSQKRETTYQNTMLRIALFDDNTGIVANGNTVLQGFTWQVGDTYRFVVSPNNIKVNRLRDSVETTLYTYSNTILPLCVNIQGHTQNQTLPKLYLYGNLQDEAGRKLHHQTVKGVLQDVNDDFYKSNTNSWDYPNDGSYFSVEYLNSDGMLTTTIAEVNTDRMIAFAYTDTVLSSNGQQAYPTRDYQLYFASNGGFQVRELNSVKYSGSYATSDIFVIQRINNVIYYRKNGIVFYTSLTPVDTTKDKLYVALDFYTQNATIKQLRFFRIGEPISETYFGGVLVHRINAVNVDWRVNEDKDIFFQLGLTFNQQTDTYTNTASINKAKIRVKNKFGEFVKEYQPFTFMGDGIIGQGYFTRKYADPDEEAIFEIRTANASGIYSLPIFYSKGVLSLTEPASILKSSCPQDLVALPVTDKIMQLSWTFGSNVDVWKKNIGGSWELIASNQSSPYQIQNLSPSTYYDFKVVSGSYFSNIERGKTLQQSLEPQQFPSPSSLTGSPVGTTEVDLSWVANNTSNTNVEIWQNGSLLNTQNVITNYRVSSLSPDTNYNFKVRNKFSSNFSDFSNEITVRTNPVVSANAPSNLNCYATSYYSIQLNWVNNGASSGVNQIWRSLDGYNFEYYDLVPYNQATYTDTTLSSQQTAWYYVKNSGLNGQTNTAFDTTFYYNPYPSCVSLDTMILTEFGLTMAMDIVEGMQLVSFDGEKFIYSQVTKVNRGKSDTLHIIRTDTNKELECTPSHPIIVNKELSVKKAGTLRRGDKIMGVNGLETITSIETLYGDFQVVIFSLNGENHTFISNGIVSHNRKEDWEYAFTP